MIDKISCEFKNRIMLEKIDKIQELLNVPNVDASTETAIANMKILNLLVDLRAEAEQLILSGVGKRFSSAQKMAGWLHNNYEEIALNNGWKTQDDCQVPFLDLPKENKQTMIEVCERFLNGC